MLLSDEDPRKTSEPGGASTRRHVRGGWATAALLTLAVTLLIAESRVGSCSDGVTASTCTSTTPVGAPAPVVVALGVAAAGWCSYRALRGAR